MNIVEKIQVAFSDHCFALNAGKGFSVKYVHVFSCLFRLRNTSQSVHNIEVDNGVIWDVVLVHMITILF